MPAARSPRAASGRTATLTIGKVIATLEADFPDLTVSKIRFLEAEGLLAPGRTPAGYRTYTSADVERLRFILTAQRDNFWPLKVIRTALEDQSIEAAEITAELPSRPVRLTAAELAEAGGVDGEVIDQLIAGGLIGADGTGRFGAGDRRIVEAVAALRGYGLETRHLRPFKAAADREIGLLEQMLAPSARGGGRDRAARAAEIAGHLLAIHGALLQKGLADLR
ncbi:MAG TPA: MerR family transcriptional regulator [Brevibacterium sp.]|nr:MerR family transcriptional regulator [Brevibacterium sp.]